MYSSINYTIEIKWKIIGFDLYGFGTDKNLYNLRTGRKLKQCYNNGSVGYWLSKKFISCKKLKTLLYIPKKEKLPF